MSAHQQAVHLGQQTLCAEGAPVGVAHILQHVLRDLFTALLGHQHLVVLLLRAEVGDPEIQQAPRQPKAVKGAVTLFGGRRTQADLAVLDAD
ncbi:hypothetical protein D3C73_1302920 [compost metagenome]